MAKKSLMGSRRRQRFESMAETPKEEPLVGEVVEAQLALPEAEIPKRESPPEELPDEEPTELLSFEIPRSLAEEFRGATMMVGPRLAAPGGGVVTSQRAMLTLMIVGKLEELRATYNDGEVFPRVPRERRRRR